MAKKKVTKAQQKRRDARAANKASQMQITPQSFQVTPETQTTGFSFTPAEKASGNIFGTDIGNGLTAYTQGAPIKDPTNLRAQLGLGPMAAAAATTGGGGKQKQSRGGGGLRSQLKAMTATDKNLGRRETKSLLGDYTPRQIVNQLQKFGGKAGLGGGAANLLTKAIQESPFGNISLAGQNLGMLGFQEGGITEALRGMVGTQRPERNPKSGRTMIGTPGTGPLSRGMQIGPGGQVRAKPQRQPIAAAPDVGQPAATAPAETEAPTDMAAMDSLGAIDSYAPDPLVSLLDEMMAGFTDAMSGYQQNQADMYSSLLDSIAATGAPRLYGAGRNYNVDAIRAALASRRPRGRSSYLRGGTTGGSPMGIGAFAPAVAGLTGGGINI